MQSNIIKRQFMVWGESIGLRSPGEGRDSVLDQIGGHQGIRDVLQQIIVTLKDVEKLQPQYGVEIVRTMMDNCIISKSASAGERFSNTLLWSS